VHITAKFQVDRACIHEGKIKSDVHCAVKSVDMAFDQFELITLKKLFPIFLKLQIIVTSRPSDFQWRDHGFDS